MSVERVLEALQCGAMEILGQLPYASNATLLSRVTHEDIEMLAVYKPRRGEAPLWDFPMGTLCQRECAAWVVDSALGWQLVPPTVLRDGPSGVGAVQLFVDEDPDCDLDALLDSRPGELMRVAAFDVIVNNADRKGSHCIVDGHGRLWAIDHGVCFNVDPKLRTVIWAFQGDPLPDTVTADVSRLAESLDDDTTALASTLATLLDADEVEALRRRTRGLLRSGRFPPPGGRRHVPWPPW